MTATGEGRSAVLICGDAQAERKARDDRRQSNAPLSSSRWLVILCSRHMIGKIRQKGHFSLDSPLGSSRKQPSGLCRLQFCTTSHTRLARWPVLVIFRTVQSMGTHATCAYASMSRSRRVTDAVSQAYSRVALHTWSSHVQREWVCCHMTQVVFASSTSNSSPPRMASTNAFTSGDSRTRLQKIAALIRSSAALCAMAHESSVLKAVSVAVNRVETRP